MYNSELQKFLNVSLLLNVLFNPTDRKQAEFPLVDSTPSTGKQVKYLENWFHVYE